MKHIFNFLKPVLSYIETVLSLFSGITNAKFLHINHVFFNRPIDHQSTSNDQLKPVLTTGLVNMHIDWSIANLGFYPIWMWWP